MITLLPEILEKALKRSCSNFPLRSCLLGLGIFLAISCAFSLPAPAEAPDDTLETVPLTLDGSPSIFSTMTSTKGEEKPPQAPFMQEDSITFGPAGPTFLDTIQADISKELLQSARWLDSFFYDPRYTAVVNETSAVVRFEGFIEDHARWTFKPKVKLRLRLPQLKYKTRITLAVDANEDNPSKPGQSLLTLPAQDENADRNTSAALGYHIKSSERRDFIFKLGLRYRGGHFVSFIRPYYRRLYHLEGWDLRFTQEFPYWTDIKWSSSTTVDLERPLGDTFFFRTTLNGTWYEKQLGYYYGLIFSLSQPLSTTSALSYDLGGSFQTGAHDVLQEVVVATRYRQRFWRDWMYFDLTPQVRFPRDRRFNPVPGILFGLEMQFGQGR